MAPLFHVREPHAKRKWSSNSAAEPGNTFPLIVRNHGLDATLGHDGLVVTARNADDNDLAIETAAGAVTESNVRDFERDGATVIRGLLDANWLDRIAEGVEFNRTHPSDWSHWYTAPDEAVGFWTDYVTWPQVEQYRRAAFESPMAGAAARLMRSDTVRFFHEHVLVKEPGATERTPWHHDQPYYCLDGDQNVSLWVSLDPVPASSGMRFLAGSHRWDRWFVPRKFIDHTPYAEAPEGFELVPDIDADIEQGQHRVVSFDIEPGDVIAFHYRTLHDAPGNALASRRRAVSFRWIGDDATFATRPWQVSPPYEPDGLAVGGGLEDDPRFPRVPIH